MSAYLCGIDVVAADVVDELLEAERHRAPAPSARETFKNTYSSVVSFLSRHRSAILIGLAAAGAFFFLLPKGAAGLSFPAFSDDPIGKRRRIRSFRALGASSAVRESATRVLHARRSDTQHRRVTAIQKPYKAIR